MTIFTKQKTISWIATIFILLATLSLAESKLTSEQEEWIGRISDRFDEVCELLSDENLTPKERAKLNYEKFDIMYNQMGLLRTATVSLYYAVYFDPDNKEYIDALCKVYDEEWKDMKLSDDGITAEDFRNIRNAVKTMVDKYRRLEQ